MSNPQLPDDWDTWDEERQARYAKLVNYIHSPAFVESLYGHLKFMKRMAKPGVVFTEEQKAQIRALPKD